MDDVIKQEEPRLLLVDTNCFLRIYHSPLRPFLGTSDGGFQILTLDSLLDEFRNSRRLEFKYAWLIEDLAREGVDGALPKLPPHDAKDVAYEAKQLRPYANSILEKHCARREIPPKSLSHRDVELLATAVVFNAVIASDEWPLKLVVEDLVSGDDGYEIEIITSLDVLHLLEKAGKLTPEERKETVLSWLRNDEKLPRDWPTRYRALFGDMPPRVQ